jgi:DNA repair protein RadC
MENVNKPSTSIKNWAIDDRPREKLNSKGAAALSNSELLAILLNELGKLSLNDFKQVKGIGQAKSIIIAAAMELGRRRHAAAALEKRVVKSSRDIADYLQASLKDYTYEVFAVVFLNRANKINHFEIISKGGITGTVADPRIILKKALEEDATSIVLCHNHPSGNLKPSLADEQLTKKIKDAAAYFDIKIIDHIIVSEEGFYSFADNGIL